MFQSQKCNLQYYFYLLSTLLILIESNTNIPYHRFEPYSLYKSRAEYVRKTFSLFSDYLEISQTYPIKCIVKKEIKSNITNIFKYNSSSIISSSFYVPFKDNITYYLNTILSVNKNTTNKFLLSLHILFEMKNNITQTFIEFKKISNQSNEINLYRAYLKNRINNPFIINYIHNLPLSNQLNQMSWSEEDIEDYKISGVMRMHKKYIQNLFTTILTYYNISNFNYNFDIWLNKENANLFYSIYHYVDIWGFVFEKDYILFPFIDICGFDYNKDTKLFYINDNELNSKNFYLRSFANYSIGNEYKFLYTYDPSNDNLLLNYGFVNFNNSYHDFVFNFDIEDPKYNFYSYLHRSNYNMDLVHILDENKITAKFSLNINYINSNLVKFFFLYNQFSHRFDKVNYDDFLIKRNDMYFIYYSTIFKNILSVIDSIHIENITNNEDKLNKYIDQLDNITDQISECDKNIKKLDDKGIIDNYENLYHFNHLHNYLNKKFIHIFNLENLVILFKHQELIYKELVSIKWKIINGDDIKNKYL